MFKFWGKYKITEEFKFKHSFSSVGKTSTFLASFQTKFFFIKDKRNWLKIKGIKVYHQKQSMTICESFKTKMYVCNDSGLCQLHYDLKLKITNTCLHFIMKMKDFHFLIYNKVQTTPNIFFSSCSLMEMWSVR